MKKIFYFIVTFIFIQIFISIPTLGVESEETKELENTNLETLAIEDVYLYPPFSNEITEYNTEISKDINNLNILAIPENENATVKIEKENTLKVGDNIITIYVTAQDRKKTQTHKHSRLLKIYFNENNSALKSFYFSATNNNLVRNGLNAKSTIWEKISRMLIEN